MIAEVQDHSLGAARAETRRRAVAVTVSATDLTRVPSDLARVLASFDVADVLVVADEVVAGEPAGTEDDGPLDVPDPLDRNVRAAGPASVARHRLGMLLGFGTEVEPVVVAALSELVGFDPEPGVYCVAPAMSGEPSADALARAARRIATVYGLPLLSYRRVHLALVENPA